MIVCVESRYERTTISSNTTNEGEGIRFMSLLITLSFCYLIHIFDMDIADKSKAGQGVLLLKNEIKPFSPLSVVVFVFLLRINDALI